MKERARFRSCVILSFSASDIVLQHDYMPPILAFLGMTIRFTETGILLHYIVHDFFNLGHLLTRVSHFSLFLSLKIVKNYSVLVLEAR